MGKIVNFSWNLFLSLWQALCDLLKKNLSYNILIGIEDVKIENRDIFFGFLLRVGKHLIYFVTRYPRVRWIYD